MAALTLTADGYVNNIRFINYIPRRELHIKRITNRQRPSIFVLRNVELFIGQVIPFTALIQLYFIQ